MQDGYTQVGAGASDNRIAGEDLQHNRQTCTADEAPTPHRVKTHREGSGGPMKHEIEQESSRHRNSKGERLKHLEDHYRR